MITDIRPIHYLIVSALLLMVGTSGVLLRRNLIVILMSVELILNAVNINLVVFSRLHAHTDGQVFALMVMAVAVAEAAVGLGLLIALYRNRGTLMADELDLLKW
jgi:NADH-quinone oxidoreductase subunit K